MACLWRQLRIITITAVFHILLLNHPLHHNDTWQCDAVLLTGTQRETLREVFSTRLWFAVHNHLHQLITTSNVDFALQLAKEALPLPETGTKKRITLEMSWRLRSPRSRVWPASDEIRISSKRHRR